MATPVTQILDAIQAGDRQAADQLLPVVYSELRTLAKQKLASERPGQTLDATGLVHEAYLKLVDKEHRRRWVDSRHFFAAAAEAMRRILVDRARRKRSQKRGGNLVRSDVDADLIAAPNSLSARTAEPAYDLLAVDEALSQLATTDAQAAELVKLRYFAGLAIPEAAKVLSVSPRTADRLWSYARAWLHEHLHGNDTGL